MAVSYWFADGNSKGEKSISDKFCDFDEGITTFSLFDFICFGNSTMSWLASPLSFYLLVDEVARSISPPEFEARKSCSSGNDLS